MAVHFDPPLNAASLVEIAQMRASVTPDDLAFCFLVDGETEGPRLTYAELNRAACALAARLRDIAQPGDRAILLYEPSIDFIPAFLGCFYAEIIPVPAYPPRLDRLAQSWSGLARLLHDCEPRIGLTTGDLVSTLSRGLANQDCPGVEHWIATDQVDRSRAGQWRQPHIDPEATAFLQYTSGSTTTPRGVMVSHRNLLHNERMLQEATEHSGPGLGVCWLPLHHDMGLLGGILQALFHGAPVMLMSPLAMVQRPIRWLQAISRYRADTSGGPNFAYDMCVERISAEQKAGLDLSNWSVAIVGAEPINPKTLERFATAFEPCGFRPEAFYPSYGLAEATLFVTGGAKTAQPVVCSFEARSLEQGAPRQTAADSVGARTLVGCGHAWMGQELVIVDAGNGTRRPAGSIGEIWVRGPSVARGYWNRLEESIITFGAKIAGEGGEPFLRTGDLGFIHDGELFVTGRCKEILIVRGRNYYPQDIEATVQSCNPALRSGGGAAFEIQGDGGTRIVIVQELDRKLGRGADLTQLAGDVRQIVAEVHALQVHDVVF
ncbi:MAG TPA: fatty acyl-AMP ligase, partial [Gemmataceae bacterium]|nr:fatty acyl-AMP ligase [Gemmataceae bacterium]